MPNGRSHKSYNDYGPHDYGREDGTSHCKHGCGCWAGPSNSGGSPGIDPFGRCPNNPRDGQRQSGNEDYEDCVNGLIAHLEAKLRKAEEAEKIIDQAKKGTKVDLIRRLGEAEREILQLKRILGSVHDALSSKSKEILEALGKSA